MDPFGTTRDLKEDFNLSKSNDTSSSILPKKNLTLILIFVVLIILTVGVLLLIFFILDKDSSNSKDNPAPIIPDNNLTASGEIHSIYSINEMNSNINLLSKEFENINNTIIDIYINV